MIHYHGTPIGGSRHDVARFLAGRHALVPFPRQDDVGVVGEVCKSFVFDNGAFSVWKRGGKLDIRGYQAWVRDWYRHPGFQWALIPDVIDGSEASNRTMISNWQDCGLSSFGAPVWHMHESLEWLERLANNWPIVALGSSGQWATPGTAAWWARMNEAMAAICDEHGRPPCKLHGLRMLDPAIFSRLPLASADSTNAAVNCSASSRFGMYVPATSAQRAAVIADRIEAYNSSATWEAPPEQHQLMWA